MILGGAVAGFGIQNPERDATRPSLPADVSVAVPVE
jgi:hypothetical protein